MGKPQVKKVQSLDELKRKNRKPPEPEVPLPEGASAEDEPKPPKQPPFKKLCTNPTLAMLAVDDRKLRADLQVVFDNQMGLHTALIETRRMINKAGIGQIVDEHLTGRTAEFEKLKTDCVRAFEALYSLAEKMKVAEIGIDRKAMNDAIAGK